MLKNIVIGSVVVGVAAGLGGAALAMSASAPVEKQRRPAPAPLLRPLSDADQTSTHGNGCQLSFTAGRDTLVFAIEHDFMIRTRAGLQVCRIGDRQFSALSGQGAQSCGGYRISIQRTGRVRNYPATDGASGPARLTVTGGGRSWSTRGQWGSAC